MKNVFVAAASALALMASGAFAGGLAPVASEVVVSPVEVEVSGNTWTAPYVGLSYMSAWRDADRPYGEYSGDVAMAFVGYRYQFDNNVVLGGEVAYGHIWDEEALDSAVYEATLQAGYAMGDFLPYASIGVAGRDGHNVQSYGLGLDYSINDNMFVGALFQRQDDADINRASVRVGWRF